MAKESKGVKFGRGSRSPSAKVYRAAQRWITNARRRVKRHNRVTAKHAIKLEMRKQFPDYGRIQELRNDISQNLHG